MSAAASRLELRSPSPVPGVQAHKGLPTPEQQRERETLERLTTATPTSFAKPVIAIDLDDVLSQTNQAIAECKCFSI